ncbi:MAG: hypothetical protein ACYTHM_19965, partial [Planctomycetota bacterium]
MAKEEDKGEVIRNAGEGRLAARSMPPDFWIGTALIGLSIVLFLLAALGVLGTGYPGAGPRKGPGDSGLAEEARAFVALEQSLWGVAGVEALSAEGEDLLPPPGGTGFGTDAVITPLRERLRESPDPETLASLAEALRRKGVALVEEATVTGSEKDRRALEEAARAAFEEALTRNGELLEGALRLAGDGNKGGSEDESGRLRNARFRQADLHFRMAVASRTNRERQMKELGEAEELYKAFIWEYESFGQAYVAQIMLGACAGGRGDLTRALEWFHRIFSLEDSLGVSFESGPGYDAIQILAFARLLRLLVEGGKHGLALEKAKELEAAFPRCVEEDSVSPDSGRRAVLEKARALAGLGRVPEAIREAIRVVSRGGPTMTRGLKLLEIWVAQDPLARTRMLLARAEGEYGSGSFRKAREAYKEVLDRLTAREASRRFGPRAWSGLGSTYFRMGLMHEAALA